MPTLTNPSERIKVPYPLSGTSSRGATTTADKVLADIEPAATTGNSVADFLTDILARLSHPTDSRDYVGAYDNSADYTAGQEVHWIDGSNRKLFFKRLNDGNDGSTGTPITNSDNWSEITNDLHEVPVVGQADRPSILTRSSNGVIAFSVELIDLLEAAQTEAEVTTAINTAVDLVAGRIADTARWRGAHATGVTYRVNDYATYNNAVYRRLTAGSDSTGNPSTLTSVWTAVTGIERLIAFRLRDIEELLVSSIGINAAQANRGRWLARQRSSEGYEFLLPPMQWRSGWNATDTFYYGNVVPHDGRTWVLTPANASDSKSGASTEPGTDVDWAELPTTSSGTIGYLGEWGDLSGQTLPQGSTVFHDREYYFVRVEHVRGSTGPDGDSTRFRLITQWAGAYRTGSSYPAGSEVTRNSNLYKANQDAGGSDVPGRSGKWTQLNGATQDDLDALRHELHNVVHGTLTTRGTLVEELSQPITDETDTPVWLPRTWTGRLAVPASQIAGNTDTAVPTPNEPGEYDATSGTLNRITCHIGAHTEGDGQFFRGALTRANEGGPWTRNSGGITHNPLSAVMGVGAWDQTDGTARVYVVMKKEIHDIWGVNSFYVRIWDGDGDEQTALQVQPNSEFPDFTHGGVRYIQLIGSYAGNANPFTAIINAGTDAASRQATIGFSGGESSGLLYLGNSTRGWTIREPITSRDELPVYSGDIHNIRFMTQSAFEALSELEPRTLYLTQRSG